MTLDEARIALRAVCDAPLKQLGFKYVNTKDGYVRRFAAGLQLIHLRFLVVAGVLRLELSAAIRFDAVEDVYHRAVGTAVKFTKLTNTLWTPAEVLTGWPIDECRLRVRDGVDLERAARQVLRFVEEYAVPYFDLHESLEDVSAELNADPFASTPHCAPPVRAFYGTIVAHLLDLGDRDALTEQHREALKGIDRGFHNPKFDKLVEELATTTSSRIFPG